MDGGSTWGDAPGAATSTTYVFTALIGQNGYEYRAQFINGAAPVDTQPATLTVSEPVAPAITTEPITDNAFVGSSASFTATASGIPAPAVQWWISTDGGPWTAISGATSTTYSFDPTLGQNGAELEAVFTNVAGSATSNPATLTVSVPLSSPQITEQPESQAVALGSNVTFSVRQPAADSSMAGLDGRRQYLGERSRRDIIVLHAHVNRDGERLRISSCIPELTGHHRHRRGDPHRG